MFEHLEQFKETNEFMNPESLLARLEQKKLTIKDLRGLGIGVEVFRSSGPGGQRKNKVETAVRLKYPALGIEAVSGKERLRSHNLRAALEDFRYKLKELLKPEKPRIPIALSRSAKAERLKEKKIQSEKKKLRRSPEI